MKHEVQIIHYNILFTETIQRVHDDCSVSRKIKENIASKLVFLGETMSLNYIFWIYQGDIEPLGMVV